MASLEARYTGYGGYVYELAIRMLSRSEEAD